MSSIRLFILSSFDQLGPMHGHRVRLEAERKHVHLWTDISVGAVYGAMKRLVSEGLLRESSREREGNRPTRQLYEITGQGKIALAELRQEGLSDIWFKFDPFDLALTRSDPAALDILPAVLAERLEKARKLAAESKGHIEYAREYITLAEEWALRHTVHRLEAEVAFLTNLLTAAPEIVADQRHPRLRKPNPVDQRKRRSGSGRRASAAIRS